MTELLDVYDARLLVVDDQDANVELLSLLLAETGYTNVTTTTDPSTVCDMHREAPFDLILLDLQMPVMDGFQVMEGLKTDAENDYLPVIVLTAQPAHKLRALQAGAKDFISKPFDLVEVKTRIYNMLEVRLLHKKLAEHNARLEQTVLERTAELRESEARFRRLTELASDWYWEQDENGVFTRMSGPVLEMLGLQANSPDALKPEPQWTGWVDSEREVFQAHIAARRPFIDFIFNRIHPDGTRQQFRVSGEPIFSESCKFMGYRGIGVEVMHADRA